MAPHDEKFALSGPTHLTAKDWANLEYRRSAAACLVRAVYVLDSDKVQTRVGPEALAPPWWEFFHFNLIETLVDEKNNSIFCAIFEYNDCGPSYSNNSHLNPPKHVVAFRGTVKKKHTIWQDFKLDVRCVMDRLEGNPYFRQTMEAVGKRVSESGAANVWLAGHSLGSAFALKAGKNMFRMGHPIETYLFNPPFMSISVEKIPSETIKYGLRSVTNGVKAVASVTISSSCQRHEREEAFDALSSWIPNMFLNPMDPICSEYIGYFEQRVKMTQRGESKSVKLAAHTSTRSLVTGSNGEDLVPLALLPSAYLFVNRSPSQGIKEAHGLKQWWKQSIEYDPKLYQFFKCERCGYLHSTDHHSHSC